jgi:hypothetical protein
MNTPADKTSESKTLSTTNSVAELQDGGPSTLQLVDNRPEAVAQRRLKAIIANSPQMASQRAIQAKIANSLVQPKPLQRMENEEPLQAKFEAEPAQLEATAEVTPRPNNTGLPDNLKLGIENLSGISMYHEKVHYNSYKPAQLQAHAYAQGSEIHVASGHEKHLPHEAWHVVQQTQGRVQPTMQMKGGVQVNDDQGLEKEADVMGEKALQLQGGQDARNLVGEEHVAGKVIQRVSGLVQRVNWDDVERNRIRIEGDETHFDAYYDDELVGELTLFEDDENRFWLNGIDVNEGQQGRGIGLSLLNAAREAHGVIYAALDLEPQFDPDVLHLTDDGFALVSSAIRNGIMQQGWLTNYPIVVEHDDEPLIEEGIEEILVEEDNPENEEEEERQRLHGCDVTITLDDENTGGIGYEATINVVTVWNESYEMTLTNPIGGEVEFTRENVERALVRHFRRQFAVITLDFEYS